MHTLSSTNQDLQPEVTLAATLSLGRVTSRQALTQLASEFLRPSVAKIVTQPAPHLLQITNMPHRSDEVLPMPNICSSLGSDILVVGHRRYSHPVATSGMQPVLKEQTYASLGGTE